MKIKLINKNWADYYSTNNRLCYVKKEYTIKKYLKLLFKGKFMAIHAIYICTYPWSGYCFYDLNIVNLNPNKSIVICFKLSSGSKQVSIKIPALLFNLKKK